MADIGIPAPHFGTKYFKGDRIPFATEHQSLEFLIATDATNRDRFSLY